MTPSTDALRSRLLAGPADDDPALIAELAAHGTPLVTDDPDDPDAQRVLLAFVAPPDSAGVYAWANRLTDGPREAHGQLRRWGDTDLWFTEITVPRGTMATYRIYPYAADDPHLRDGALVYSRTVAAAAVSDPGNDQAASPFGSVLRTDGAPDLAVWHRPAPAEPAARGSIGDGPEATGWRLTAPVGGGSGPTRIVVLFDGQNWLDRIGLATRLAEAVGEDDGPIALLGIDSPAEASARMRLLGPNRDFLATVVDDVLPRARHALGVADSTTVWAGQSLGAVSTLAVVRWFPDVVDEVLAYSPSMWWKPGITARPAEWDPQRCWLTEELADAQPRPVRLAVGRNEHLLVEPVDRLAGQLRTAGWPVTLRRFDGGHDIAWWAHLLVDDLTTPIGRAEIEAVEQ
ncbi:alpha/beta hydrolase-fold protein [Gordonia crocea]|uniref:Enterochelin esterase n=1 Tax=Gordonia crocea TaxID=589162 RepID=A0A7I9UWU7_9ACTN|nr:alpha/beta hydrolase-fold protein [Gordonia crocea]GED97250.1 enterochelin esterase [Gordonia crocea]